TDVEKELWKQAASLSRSDMVYKVLKSGTLIVTVKNLAEGVEIINRFAPEHLELLVKNPRTLLKKITAAGAIFVGPWTPESAGDFAAGPSHVLPTGGAAAMFSGLTVDDFRRRSSIIELTRKDLSEVLPVIEAFGRVEGLDAHVRSAQVRFE
ncbi:MAG: histidinol dehydrogenase, partial [Kiritimatiellia bacterium]